MQKGFVPILILILIVVVGIAGGAYYFGYDHGWEKSLDKQNPNIYSSPGPTGNKPTPSPDETANWKTYTSEKLKDVSFESFSIKYPSNWILDIRRIEPDLLSVKLSQKDYNIEISQGGYDGSVCLFDGDKDFDGPNADYRGKQFTEIDTDIGTFRRVHSTLESMFWFCQLSGDTFASPTTVGKMFYEVPLNPDQETLLEMDSIVKTIKTIN